MKAEQKMTKKQREAAMKLSADWLSRRDIGEQPGFVLNADGEVLLESRLAVCLAWLYNQFTVERIKKEKKTFPILFQVVIDKSRCSQIGTHKMQFDMPFVQSYLKWSVNSQLISPYICKHTVAERQFFIPIALENVPLSAPLLTSTHVRFLWDRHNNTRNINVGILREQFPKWSWEMVMVVANCFTDLSQDEVYMQTFTGGHAPFGDASTHSLKAYVRKQFAHDKHMGYGKYFFGSADRGRVDARFDYGGQKFSTVLRENIPVMPDRYGSPVLKGKEKIAKAVKTVYNLLKKEVDDE